jgi:membrane-associated phospholipid phosphatase
MVAFLKQHRRLIFVASLAAILVFVLATLPPGLLATLAIALLQRGGLLALLVLSGVLILSLVWAGGNRLDREAFLALNLGGKRPAWLDRAMVFATQGGSAGFGLAVALLFYLTGRHRDAAEISLGMLLLWLIVEGIKALTGRARPFRALERARILISPPPGKSFPSGHTAQAFFLASAVSRFFQLEPFVVIGLNAAASLVGLTRVYVGAHYPRDVLGGALLGSLWGLLAQLIFHF